MICTSMFPKLATQWAFNSRRICPGLLRSVLDPVPANLPSVRRYRQALGGEEQGNVDRGSRSDPQQFLQPATPLHAGHAGPSRPLLTRRAKQNARNVGEF